MKTSALLLLGVLSFLAFSPTATFAHDDELPVAANSDATLYEVTETVRFNPGTGVSVTLRDAVATLMGSANVGTPLCPTAVLVTNPATKTCTVTGQGQDSVSLATGQGPVSGVFAVVVNAPGNSSVHVPDLAILTGTFQGTVDLSPAVLSKIPLGFLRNGQILIDGTTQPMPFSGTFRLPFALDRDGKAKELDDHLEKAFYLGDDGRLIPIGPKERAVGFPLVRLEVKFGL